MSLMLLYYISKNAKKKKNGGFAAVYMHEIQSGK